MEEMVKIKVMVSTGMVGSAREIETAIEREDWEEMDEEQRSEFIWDTVVESGIIDYGWEIVE